MKRIALFLLLVIQTLGGGAVTLAHARDVVVAQPGYEASHDGRCAILHNELRCALCHYAGARVVVQHAILVGGAPAVRLQPLPMQHLPAVASAIHLSAPPRAPPPLLS
jgi:hypothetical protein